MIGGATSDMNIAVPIPKGSATSTAVTVTSKEPSSSGRMPKYPSMGYHIAAEKVFQVGFFEGRQTFPHQEKEYKRDEKDARVSSHFNDGRDVAIDADGIGLTLHFVTGTKP